jgi:hypothetical protein
MLRCLSRLNLNWMAMSLFGFRDKSIVIDDDDPHPLIKAVVAV